MSEFVPTIAVLPGHPLRPEADDVDEFAYQLAKQHSGRLHMIVPAIPKELRQDLHDTTVWAEPSGFPASQSQITGMDKLRRNMAGANGLLIVNTEDQREQGLGGLVIVRHSISDRISATVAFENREDGVPVAITHQFVHEGGDTPYGLLATRMQALQNLGAAVVGEDLAGLPDFLARMSPDFAVGPVV